MARQLLALEQQVEKETAPEAKAKLYYRWASALYNMSYYGNNWNAVAYDRTGSDWNEGNYKLAWQKEYYGVYRAKGFYEKAYALTADREFKAACLFLVAKCRQRQFARPDYSAPMAAEKAFERNFRENPYFPQYIREFGDTRFYKYSYNRCGYLRDFVKKQQQPKAPVKK
ncbi:hypothetical protein [Flaviaesturariibacter amylovorans]|uniref:Tetratricopeptide repeat protein n=1 Tax=Flaviaesturariibacter amylovorans TaxID=1084520 RepID=A0ABP8H8W6_9BACT